MIRLTSRFLATTATVACLLGVSSIAFAGPGHRHEIRRLEAKVARLQAKENSEIAHHRDRAAARTQAAIDRTRAEIRALRH